MGGGGTYVACRSIPEVNLKGYCDEEIDAASATEVHLGNSLTSPALQPRRRMRGCVSAVCPKPLMCLHVLLFVLATGELATDEDNEWKQDI